MKDTQKRLITWKDADQNLCTLAASMFENAMIILRSPANSYMTEFPLEGGKKEKPGFVEEDKSKRTIFSGPEVPFNGYTYPGMGGDGAAVYNPGTNPTAVCWWSFQNLIRQRLDQARQEIMDNLYTRKKVPKQSKQRSRNRYRRSVKSKFGRKAERE